MTAEQPSTNSATPLLHSQLDLPIRKVPTFVITDDYESLWMRVTRICDQYIQNLLPAPAAGSRLEWECSRSLRTAIPTEGTVRVYNCENFEEGGCS